jgi:acyl-CoA thioester hydrolase
MTDPTEAGSSGSARHTHSIRIRYGEIDQQGVVFNAHYVAYIDDAVEAWLADFHDMRLAAEPGTELAEWDFMLKKIEVEWLSSARYREPLEIDMAVRRWGNSSFAIDFLGRVEDRTIFQATVIYVSVVRVEHTPTRSPDVLRAYLGDASPLF